MKTAVLCRTKAPLVTCAFDLIKLGRGIKVKILGRDTARILINLVGEVLDYRRNCSINEFEILLDAWLDEIHNRYGDNEKYESILAEHNDNHSCLKAICIPCKDAKDVIDTINEYFCDEDDDDVQGNENIVVFANGHKSKGLEWDRVILLRPDLCPHPAAETEDDLAQEEHLLYVMGSRGKEEFYVCHDTRPD